MCIAYIYLSYDRQTTHKSLPGLPQARVDSVSTGRPLLSGPVSGVVYMTFKPEATFSADVGQRPSGSESLNF